MVAKLENLITGIPASLLVLAIAGSAYARDIEGHIESLPAKQGVFGRISFANLNDDADTLRVFSDSLGVFSVNLQDNATYRRIVEINDHNLFGDIITVNDTLNMNLQMIQNIDITSPYHSNFLDGFKIFTATIGQIGLIKHWSQMPIRLYARNFDPDDSLSMPDSLRLNFDDATRQIVAGTDSVITFNEQDDSDGTGIDHVYPLNNNMPRPGILGWTEIGANPDRTPGYAVCYINRERNNPRNATKTFLRERLRSLGVDCTSPDSLYMSGLHNVFADSLHPDELKYLKVFYLLKNFTRMSSYTDSVVSGIVPPNVVVPRWNVPVPVSFISSAYPNPFNHAVNIQFQAPADGLYELSVFNTAGQLVSRNKIVGRRDMETKTSISFNDYPSGQYHYQINPITNNGIILQNSTIAKPVTGSMTLVK